MDLQGNHGHEKPGPKEKGKSSKSEGDKAGKSSVQGRETASTIGHVPLGPSPPCGACKFLRRKCIAGCIFSPYFGSDQGAARFAAVHKVFGASNVSKLLLHIPAHWRQDAVVTISYEAQARLSDPVYGCISTILALQHQVASLQAELAMVQSQLINSRLAVASALRNAVQQEQEMSMMHAGPGYSNASSTSNNLISLANDGYPSGFGLADTTPTAIGGRGFHPLHLPRPSPDDGEEEDSRNSIVFATSILDRK